MTHYEFALMVAGGVRPVITFNKGIHDCEVYAEPGMRARVIGATDEYDETIKITVSFEEFEESNTQFESKNYYDLYGAACLTAREAGYYTVIDTIYLMGCDETGTNFDITTFGINEA